MKWALLAVWGCGHDFGAPSFEDPERKVPAETSSTSLWVPPLTPHCGLDVPEPYAVATDPSCRSEPEVGTFTPVTEWSWRSNPVVPDHHQVMSTPIVADVDGDEVPDVVFTSFVGRAYTAAGALTVLDGATGATRWSKAEIGGHLPYGTGGVAVGDLDGDGTLEIVVNAVGGLLAVDPLGELVWFAPLAPRSAFAFPALADLEGDGLSEVVLGNTVVEHDGTVRWVGTGGRGGDTDTSFPVDLDGDGLMEVVAGDTVYEYDGTIRWQDALPDGYPAVADFDADGSPDIVRVYSDTVYCTDAWGHAMWTASLTGGRGGPPTVADFDGDGRPEVGVAGRHHYRVFDGDGTELWVNPIQDWSSASTGSSVFDFEGDGAAEVVYADEETLWVFDGATGAVELEWRDHSSGTAREYPVIVDVDRDGSAEIVVASNDYAFSGSTGITVIGDLNDSWAEARPVWNQHAYHITNVADDGAIPTRPAPSWDTWNSFRAGNSQTATGLDRPDLAIGGHELCEAECASGVAVLWIAVENEGAAASPPFTVSIGTDDVLVEGLDAGEAVWVGPVRVSRDALGPGGLRVVVHGGAECDETDNVYEIAFPCPPPPPVVRS